MNQQNHLFIAKLKEKGGNKSAIGRLIGVSSQLLGQYANGRQVPKRDFFAKWKAAYNEDITNLFETNVSRETGNGDSGKLLEAIYILAESHKTIAAANSELAEANRSLAKSNEELVAILRINFGDTASASAPGMEGVPYNRPDVEDLSSGKKNTPVSENLTPGRKKGRPKGSVA